MKNLWSLLLLLLLLCLLRVFVFVFVFVFLFLGFVCLLLFVVNKAQFIPFGSATIWAWICLIFGLVSSLDLAHIYIPLY